MEKIKSLEIFGTASTQTETNNILKEHDLDNCDCEVCGNTGYIVWLNDENVMCSKECECMAKRRSIRRIRNSGMSDMVKRYTFDNYLELDNYRSLIKQRAKEYLQDSTGWFYVCGQSGSGKSHICVAVCNGFMEMGKEVYYMGWREESVILKSLVNNGEEYNAKMQKIKNVDVLYIDDFLKAGCSEADIRLAFEILNSRYNNEKLRTVISSEITLTGLFEIDEALAGRIYERSAKPRYLIKAPKENYRIRQMTEEKFGEKNEVENKVVLSDSKV